MSDSTVITEARLEEARRQAEICNACRYCEGYCAVFPSIFALREFTDADLTHFANLCHDCRGCYYACQYAPPHEFAVNFPKALADTRAESWQRFAWPRGFARAFHRNGVVISALLVAGFALMIFLMTALGDGTGKNFYAYLSHTVMVAVFTPAFLLPLAAAVISTRRYIRHTSPAPLTLKDMQSGLRAAATMKNLKGGSGEGCNFEDTDRASPKRHIFHGLTLYGFLLCFASTTSATIMHYAFASPAPYGFFSVPKLLGVPGGIILCIGTAGLALLKSRADPALEAENMRGGDMAFIALLFGVSFTGLLLYALTGTAHVAWGLPLHLGFVFAFFIATPYSKMVHGFYRLAALMVEAGRQSP